MDRDVRYACQVRILLIFPPAFPPTVAMTVTQQTASQARYSSVEQRSTLKEGRKEGRLSFSDLRHILV